MTERRRSHVLRRWWADSHCSARHSRGGQRATPKARRAPGCRLSSDMIPKGFRACRLPSLDGTMLLETTFFVKTLSSEVTFQKDEKGRS
jgi:hypothetical protein